MQTPAPVTAVTAVADTPLAEAADQAVVLDFADEESVVQTVFATTALMLLRASLGEPLDEVVEQAARGARRRARPVRRGCVGRVSSRLSATDGPTRSRSRVR